MLFRGGDVAVERFHRDIQHQCGLLQGGAVGEQPFCLRQHRRGHFPFPAADAPFQPCRLQPGEGALDDQLAFHLRQRTHDVKEEAPHRRAGVDAVGEAAEVDAFRIEFADQGDQVANAAAEAVELPHHQGVTGGEPVQRPPQTGAPGFFRLFYLQKSGHNVR